VYDISKILSFIPPIFDDKILYLNLAYFYRIPQCPISTSLLKIRLIVSNQALQNYLHNIKIYKKN